MQTCRYRCPSLATGRPVNYRMAEVSYDARTRTHVQPLSRLDLYENMPGQRCYELGYRYDARFFRPRCTILSRERWNGTTRSACDELAAVTSAASANWRISERNGLLFAPSLGELRAEARIFFYLRKPRNSVTQWSLVPFIYGPPALLVWRLSRRSPCKVQATQDAIQLAGEIHRLAFVSGDSRCDPRSSIISVNEQTGSRSDSPLWSAYAIETASLHRMKEISKAATCIIPSRATGRLSTRGTTESPRNSLPALDTAG